jgi:hypothetical protein
MTTVRKAHAFTLLLAILAVATMAALASSDTTPLRRVQRQGDPGTRREALSGGPPVLLIAEEQTVTF